MKRFSDNIARVVWMGTGAMLMVAPNAVCQPRSDWIWSRAPKELRVGADNAAPFHTIQSDGSVRGLAVDILNEAARRRNIHLTWIPMTTMKLDEALARKVVDAWSAVSRTPERERNLHFSKPWIETDYSLLSRRSANITRLNTAGIRLAVATYPRLTNLASQFFPNSKRVPELNNFATVQAVCRGDVAAGFLDARILDSALLDRPEGCGDVALHIQFIPEASNPVSIASRPEAAEIVDDLRSSISRLATDGTFAAAVDRWCGFSGSQTRSYFALREAEMKNTSYFYALLVLTGTGLVLIWLIRRTHVAKRRTEVALAAAAHAQELTHLGEERWQLALEGTNDGIWDWNAKDNTVYYSARWKAMLGYEEWELPNLPNVWEQHVHPEDVEGAKAAITQHLNRQTPFYNAEYRIRCKDGEYKWVLARGKAVWDGNGDPVRMIGSHADVTERRRADEQLRYQASHDPLTGLLNRRYFLSRLEELIESSEVRSGGLGVCLCLCDIDHFKGVNDRYGHSSGDEVLVTFGRTIRDGIRKLDLAGRMGGDEFYVLLTDITLPQAASCIERMRDKLQTVAFSSDSGMVFSATASFGIAELAGGMSSTEFIEAADRALYSAKERGRNYVFPCISVPIASSGTGPEGESETTGNRERRR